MTFSEMGLADELLQALQEQGYDEPTQIQAQAIPRILAGHDVMASAQTGTGKTAGFTLPMLELLMQGHKGGKKKSPRALVILSLIHISEPTRPY